MGLLCELGRHRAGPRPLWNEGYYFSQCRTCGRDLVRTSFDRWQVPRGYRVVWGPKPPPGRPTAHLAPAPPWEPAKDMAETETESDHARGLNAEALPDRPARPTADRAMAPSASGPIAPAPMTASAVALAMAEEPAPAATPGTGLTAGGANACAEPAVRSIFAWADPAPPTAPSAGEPSIGEVLRMLREEDARARSEPEPEPELETLPPPEGGTLSAVSEPVALDLVPFAPNADRGPQARAATLSARRQRSRRGVRVAIATAIALAGLAIAARQVQAESPALSVSEANGQESG